MNKQEKTELEGVKQEFKNSLRAIHEEIKTLHNKLDAMNKYYAKVMENKLK